MAKKAVPTSPAPSPAPFIDRGEPLARAYAHNRIVPLVRDPEHIWIYWDVESEVRIAASPLLIRIHCLSEERHWDLHPGPEADNWYLRLAPDRTYRFELFEKRADGLRLLATSRDATTPVRWSGQNGEELPAEVIHAGIHPLTRKAQAVAGARHLSAEALSGVEGAKADAAPLQTGMVSAAPIRPHRAPRHAPPSAPPVLVPTPFPTLFSKGIASGRGK